MMFRYVATLVIAASVLASMPAAGQDYLFSVPQMQMVVTVKNDASAQIDYDILFRNDPRGHAMDIVDIGVPKSNYPLSSVRASIDGRPLGDVRVSTQVSPGFEVYLGPLAIPPGGSGRLHVQFDVPNMVYQDTTRSDYASLRINPTWFGEQYVRGTTGLQIAIQLPRSVKPGEVLHQGLNFSKKAVTDAGAMVGWDFPNVRLTSKHAVAVSFPKRDMQQVVHQTAISLLLDWFRDSTEARLILGAVFLALLAFLFFRFSGGTGFSVFVILAAAASALFLFSPGAHLLSLPVVVVLIGLNEWLLGRAKSHYMPPIAQVEGGGIKRGLTAPEAAVLLELPVAKVLSLVIFGMLKKGMLRQMQADPLVVVVNEPFIVDEKAAVPASVVKDTASPAGEAVPQAAAELYGNAAVKQGVVINSYERPFLFLIQNNAPKPVRDIDFSVPMRILIRDTAARMKGFDLSDTKDYYRAIIRKAVEQASAIGDIPQREKAIDRNFEWILMDDGFPTVFTYGRPYYPTWTRGSTSAAGPLSAPGGDGSSTSFGDVAASFSGWAENTMGGMASAISPGALTMERPGGGFIDLSGADHVASDFFQSLAESAGNSGGGGGGGGCACACAGCACACACAGGGR